MGRITLAGGSLVESMGASLGPDAAAHGARGLAMLALFASYVCSAMAMRYFNHAGFVMSMPADSEQRKPLDPRARASTSSVRGCCIAGGCVSS